MQVQIEPGVRLFVDVDGMGLVPDGPRMREKPTLICMHGGPGFDHSTFKPSFSQLTDIAQVIMYDHRSHGRSDPRPKNEWMLDVWADDIVRLCNALGIEKPIVLGQSFGGIVAQHYLARHSQHPSKVILSSTTHHWGLERKVEGFGKRGGEPARIVTRNFWQNPNEETFSAYWETCRYLYNTFVPRTPEQKKSVEDAAARIHMNKEILFHFGSGEKKTLHLLEGLQKTCCPVLVMAGEEDPVCPPEDSLEIAEANPAKYRQLVRFPGVGHGAWRDDTKTAFTVLRKFIDPERA